MRARQLHQHSLLVSFSKVKSHLSLDCITLLPPWLFEREPGLSLRGGPVPSLLMTVGLCSMNPKILAHNSGASRLSADLDMLKAFR